MLPNITQLITTILFKISSGFILLLLFSIQFCYAQTDTLYSNNQKIVCTVKEITPDGVKFILPGEDIINTVYKNMVQKIVYKGGRIQTFAEASSYRAVKGVNDYNKITITTFEGEVKGLFKLGNVSSKSKGTTIYSGQERVKDRAYRKIKIQAAMFGANVVLLTNQRTEGNKFNLYFLNSSTAETNLTGIAYSNVSTNYDEFKRLTGSNTSFTAIKKFELGESASNVSEQDIMLPFLITSIFNENGIVLIEGSLKGNNSIFQLAHVTHNSFSITYKANGNVYSYVIKA